MYISTLLIDVGDNPDRPRPGRLWLRNLYRVHQRLCMGFPSARRKEDDPDFLKPYDPSGFAHVHAKRGAETGFLFRIEPKPGGNPVIVVLSAIRPDWGYAFHNARYLLAAEPEKPRPLQLRIESGDRYAFCLVANPTKRAPLSKAQRQEQEAAGNRVKRPRRQLTWDAQRNPADAFKEWLADRARGAGFRVEKAEVSNIGYAYARRGDNEAKSIRLRTARYEGVLEVTDADAFRKALLSGIGPAKAFGCGLLSIAPIRT